MKRAVPVLLCALLTITVEAGPLRVPYEMFRLPNGLTVIVHEDHSAPIASVNAWYHVGSGRETPGRTGFAHLFEHLMFEGSKNVPEGAFDQWLEALGGNNNGSTTPTAPTTTRTSRPTPSRCRCSSSPTAWASCSTR